MSQITTEQGYNTADEAGIPTCSWSCSVCASGTLLTGDRGKVTPGWRARAITRRRASSTVSSKCLESTASMCAACSMFLRYVLSSSVVPYCWASRIAFINCAMSELNTWCAIRIYNIHNSQQINHNTLWFTTCKLTDQSGMTVIKMMTAASGFQIACHYKNENLMKNLAARKCTVKTKRNITIHKNTNTRQKLL